MRDKMEFSVYPKRASVLDDAEEIGYINCSYDRLVEVFGNPIIDVPFPYIDCEWNIMLENGHPLAIMNWKNGIKYLGSDGTEMGKIGKWRVTGHYEYDLIDLKGILNVPNVLNLTMDLKSKSKDDLIKRLKTIVEHIQDGAVEASKSSDWHTWKIEEITGKTEE